MPTLRLEGWKQIAHYLNRTERTVQVWARKRSMPIHRSSSGKGRIFVEPAELDSWKAATMRPQRKAGRKAITVRLPNADYEEVKRICVSRSDAVTVQDLVALAVSDYLQRVA
jgi:hypothetical protein